MRQDAYRERTYRKPVSHPDLISFQVSVRETDLFIAAKVDLSDIARESIYRYRTNIESYAKSHHNFLTTLTPLPEDPLAPEIVRTMLAASSAAHVGPMASVAGAMAEFVGRDLLAYSDEVIVENGGDIYLNSRREISVGIFAGKSLLSNKISLRIDPGKMPLGICTSSGTVGPSLSMGIADAVCVLSHSAALADAAASQIGNRIRTAKDIQRAIDTGSKILGILGIVIIIEKHLGAWGDIVIA
ncbi:MAG: UPF0280 family protein [Syntrophales bacterium]|nr:UPF0280 family protein [Syntrophales bacterium]